MSKNIDQVFVANPITTNASTDLMYFGQSPYSPGDDAAMLYSDFVAQLPTGVSAAQVQQNAFNSGVDSGTADVYVVTLSPSAPFTPGPGTIVSFNPLNTNLTSSPTLKVNGSTPALPIVLIGAYPVYPQDLSSGNTVFCAYDTSGPYWILINPDSSYVSPYVLANNTQIAATDSGVAANVYVCNPPGFTVAPSTGSVICVNSPQNTNTGPSTLTVGTNTNQILLANGAALTGGEINGAASLYMIFAGGSWYLLNPAVTTTFTTAPAASQDSALTLGSAYQNPFAYDVILTVYLDVSAATTASISLGVGPTNSPTQQTIISSITAASDTFIPVTIYLPVNYWALLSTTGTITATISGQQAMPV